ncbi:uncharacterized protein LOC124651729, partial [Lolium rigidum]|uniref:uncharacterized protein LOC124651729 n=1 Tax=Lolium rigidum TaxID=89674 RepID=UPI001F5DC4E8
ITTTTTITTVSTTANGTTITTATTTSNATTTTTSTTATSADTTISSLSEDNLCEIFLRLPDLPALVRATLTCRSWLGVVRSSLAFRRLFRALHPAPLIGLFLTGDTYPFFIPLRPSDSDSDSNPGCDSDVTAALRRGDFFLTSLPQSFSGWAVTDCRDGILLLWNKLDNNDLSLATLNPMTWAVNILPLPGGIADGSRRHLDFVGFHLQSSEEKPWLFRVICVCTNKRRVRAAIFSSETWDWVIQPWVPIGGNNSLKFKVGSLVNGSIYWPFHGEGHMIRINTDTLDTTVVDLPEQVDAVNGCNFRAGETKDGELCIVYHSGLLLHVWSRSVDSDGTEIWVPQNRISFSAEIDRFTQDLPAFIRIVQVRSGYVYLSMTYMTPAGTQRRSFFSIALDTLVLDLLLEGAFDDYFYPYIMAWPPSLVADDGRIGHDAEGSL